MTLDLARWATLVLILSTGPASDETQPIAAGPTTRVGAAAAMRTTASFPLRLKRGERYLVDSRGQPFLIHGDAAWSLLVQLKRDEVDDYLEDRVARGFNALLVNLIEHI
jgi:hypothetical protein